MDSGNTDTPPDRHKRDALADEKHPPLELVEKNSLIRWILLCGGLFCIGLTVFGVILKAPGFFRQHDLTSLGTTTKIFISCSAALLTCLALWLVDKGHRRIGYSAGVLAVATLVLVTIQRTDSGRQNLVLIRDQSTLAFLPSQTIGMRSVNLLDIDKLLEVGELRASDTILSAVEAPTDSLRNLLEASRGRAEPILSFQQVLYPSDGLIVDVSTSNFIEETAIYLRQVGPTPDLVFVVHPSFVDIERKLRRRMIETLPGFDATTALFENAKDTFTFPENATLVYIGPTAGLDILAPAIGNRTYGELYIPSWAYPQLRDKALPFDDPVATMVSTVFGALAEGDSEEWQHVIETLEYAEVSGVPKQSALIKHFLPKKNIIREELN